jgi:hypothetical protein
VATASPTFTTTFTFVAVGTAMVGTTPRWVVVHADGEVYNPRFTYATEEEATERARSLCQYGAPNRVELRQVPFYANKWGHVAFRPDPENAWSDGR